MASFCGMQHMVVVYKGLVKCFFIEQVKTLHEKRDKMLGDLESELKKFKGGIANVDGYYSWIEHVGKTATLKDIEAMKKGIQQFVRLMFF